MGHDEFLARCTALVPQLAAHAAEGERLRRVPDAVVEAVRAADLFAVVVPTSLGGHGLGLDAIAQGTRILAHGCPATAWTMSFLMLHGWLLSKFPRAACDELFANGAVPLASAPLAPTGQITPADGGFVVRGRWEWATAVAHGDWVMVHALQLEPAPTTVFAVLPRADVRVEDVWFTAGMRATGSNVVHVDGVFVPAHRTIAARTLLDSVESPDGDGLANVPVASVLSLVASAPALGAAEAAVGLYRERLAQRVLAYSLGDRAAEQPAAQVRLATATSDLAAARCRWDAAIAAIAAAAAAGRPSDALRVDTRLAAAATVRAARQIVTHVCDGAGASVYYEEHPLQRLQRDVETLKGHVVFDWDRTAELAGRFALGFGLRPTDMV
jgi:3-hydroxy-9,10-secoandrosta-1,3,5(10)-triene-9,17-dione monooxygenase